jgi:hypothetical protein
LLNLRVQIANETGLQERKNNPCTVACIFTEPLSGNGKAVLPGLYLATKGDIHMDATEE